ncbi:ABC transporter ATP-binding protein [bacterium LRH843]|nr:ABC transporter ATP-binding protein [bacterium LRH843]
MSQQGDSIISLKDIVWIRDGKNILNHVSWDVKQGQHWALLGLNGSGKTSLLKMITGYQWPNGGEVSVLGHRFGQVNIQELRKSIGWVSMSLDDRFQVRSRDTALEIVLSGKSASVGLYEEVTKEEIERGEHLLEQFNISHLANQFFPTLSQGERRKAMIARALMANPRLLILDEPCNGLDIYSQEELLKAIETLCQTPSGPTLLYVTHHVEELVPSISHALLLKSGNVVAAGEKKAILHEDMLEQTFSVPVALQWEEDRPWIRIKSKSIVK